MVFAQFVPKIVIGGYRVNKVYNTYKKVKGLKKAVKGPGAYVINYSNVYKYIGKGNLNRANQSAKRYSKKHGYYTNASKNIIK